MPNRFTRVPAEPVPPLPLPGRVALPVADAFMLAMMSRPASGSLRTTWVTPATLWLCALVVVGGVLVTVLAVSGVLGWGLAARVAVVLVSIAVGAGAAAVVAVGLLQRR